MLKYKFSVSVLAGSAITVLLATTYHVGWSIREFGELEEILLLLVLTFLVPLILIFVASIRENIKNVVLFANAMLFIVSMYVVLLNGVNYVLPKDMRFDLMPKVFYLMLLGSCITFVSISSRELLRLSRTSKSWELYILLTFVVAGLLLALIVSLGSNGWFLNLIISAIILLASLLFYLSTAKQMVLDQVKLYHQKSLLGEYFVKDKSKGIKVGFYSFVTILNLGLLLGINGMALQEVDYSGINWNFYIAFIFGGPAGIFVSRAIFGNIHSLKRTPGKERHVQVGWLAVLMLQILSTFTGYHLEIVVPGFHGSLDAQFIDGLMFSFVISSFLMVILVLHPPRSSHRFYMLIIYFLVLGLSIGSALKATAVLGVFTEEVQVYFPYILYIQAPLILVIILLFITIFIRSIPSRATIARLKTGGS
ncbi:MAG: hypothetical protein ACFFCS_05000 [Candidatus Hodarchaeota archaeon]